MLIKKILKSVILVVFIFQIGCERINEGVIIDKEFVPAYTDSGMRMEYNFFSKKYELTSYTDHFPDRWYITFKKMVDETTLEYKTREVSVDQSTFNKYNLNDWIILE